jgi:hypothetical protein
VHYIVKSKEEEDDKQSADGEKTGESKAEEQEKKPAGKE